MNAKSPLPPQLGAAFSVPEARRLGVSRGRLNSRGLERPHRGVRSRLDSEHIDREHVDSERAAEDNLRTEGRYERAERIELARIDALAQRLVPGQFLSHRGAARVWGMPLPFSAEPELHVSSISPARAPRIRNVRGHRAELRRSRPQLHNGYPVASAAATWASLGSLTLIELVAAGDYLLRRYRDGHGRREVGKPPLATIDDLRKMVELGRWNHMPRLSEALVLVREDSWSPRESLVRIELVRAGLPEPELNADLFDERGRFLGCGDLVYRRYKVLVEYHEIQHGDSFAADVERVERLRAAGWIVIQVTKVLAAQRSELVRRVAQALRSRGWGENA